MNHLVHQASGPIGDYVKTAAKLTPAIDAKIYFDYIFDINIHKVYNANNVLEVGQPPLLQQAAGL